ncbi:hypothetical protein GCM10010106_05410 [Thermopolyspora flexuosa]|uniref:RDD family protein n=1 Tax=Thermopolyspora flexuosa TaxID=103836 RepID=A0A543IZ26_9ACTN|nr:RDD family protein [Thermopolyspora flexuosa]TQM75823.1 RDD family protein [Thermopolyspora flexuosa]GGM62281.1 hypothetical protein GCM10010106_05410 [Thermopolyspora flexuosa]
MTGKLRPASEARRAFSSAVDAILSLAGGLAGAAALSVDPAEGTVRLGEPRFWIALAGIALGVSFCNHVVLTALGLASVGKLLTGTRLVRESDGARPGLLQMVRRWLWGFYWMLVIVPISVASMSDVNQEDMAGLRLVRR